MAPADHFQDGSSNPLEPDQKYGAWGESDTGYGVVGTSSTSSGVQGGSINGIGAVGTSETGTGVYGASQKAGDDSPQTGPVPGGIGVEGENNLRYGTGVSGHANFDNGVGVKGTGNVGVWGVTEDRQVPQDNNAGVVGQGGGYGVRGYGDDVGLYAHNLTAPQGNRAWLGTAALAGDFYGDVHVQGRLQKDHGGFLIDHPLDPGNKYLAHSFVESTEMKNVYDGVAVLNSHGEALVELPDWFEVVNGDFRYQLTPVSAAAPSLHVAAELTAGAFTIAGGEEGLKVCWQVTGVRKDPVAMARPMQVEQDKPPAERGHYLHPELHGEPEVRSIAQARYQLSRGQAEDPGDFAPEVGDDRVGVLP